MESLEKQIDIVSDKVDTLQAAIQQLNSNMADVLLSYRSMAEPLDSKAVKYQALNQDLSNHKDVLDDLESAQGLDSQSKDSLSTDLQIQRLTAQLTAAYGRIAALEEQLLSQRERQR